MSFSFARLSVPFSVLCGGTVGLLLRSRDRVCSPYIYCEAPSINNNNSLVGLTKQQQQKEEKIEKEKDFLRSVHPGVDYWQEDWAARYLPQDDNNNNNENNENETTPVKRILKKGKRQILFIRHGQYENEGNSKVEESQRKLTPLGQQQAKETGLYLKQLILWSSEALELEAEYLNCKRVYRAARRQTVMEKENNNNNENENNNNNKVEERKEEELQAERNLRYADIARRSASKVLIHNMIHAVYSSDLTRAKETAALIVEPLLPFIDTTSLPNNNNNNNNNTDNINKINPVDVIRIDKRLRECYPVTAFPPRPTAYQENRIASLEEEKAVDETFGAFIATNPLLQNNNNINNNNSNSNSLMIIVSHSNLIRYLLLRALQVSPHGWRQWSLPHCSIVSITIDEATQRVKAEVLGASHLSMGPTVHNLKS